MPQMDKEHLFQLCADYELGIPVKVDANQEGVLNMNYVLATEKGKFFIKSVRDKKKSHIPYIADVEEFMQSCGIPAIGMLSTRLDRKFVTYGTDVYTVYPFIDSVRTHIYDLADFRRMGEMLGHVHRAGSSSVPDVLRAKQFKERSAELVVEKLRAYGHIIETKLAKDETDILFLKYIHLKLEMMSRTAQITPLPLGTLTHGDYHTRNLLIDGTRKVIGICDWEQASMNARSYELARSLLYVCFNGRSEEEPNNYDNDMAMTFAQAFISGYSYIYPISYAELVQGMKSRWKQLVRSFWIEEQYYTNKDARSYKFISHEMRLILDFANEDLVNKLL